MPLVTTEIDRDKTWHIENHLRQLSKYAEDFFHAVALFDIAGANAQRVMSAQPINRVMFDRFVQWQFIAARDGAMTIFHFAKSLDALKASVGDCAPVSGHIDHNDFRAARRKFREAFKDFEPVRHAVAHSGELAKNAKSRARNAFSGNHSGPGIEIEGSTGVMINSQLVGRTFTNTYEGKIVSYDLSWENWAILDGIVASILGLFPSR